MNYFLYFINNIYEMFVYLILIVRSTMQNNALIYFIYNSLLCFLDKGTKSIVLQAYNVLSMYNKFN